MADDGNEKVSEKQLLHITGKMHNLSGAVLVAVIAIFIANYLGYVPNLFRDPRILISLGLSTEDEIIDSAIDLIKINPDHIHRRGPALKDINLDGVTGLVR